MNEQPNDPGGRPKILNNMTALIGGTTALVVAVAGLMTATKDLWHKEPQVKATTAEEAAVPVPAAGTDAEADEPAPASDSYTVSGGDGGTLSKVDGMWVWTADDNSTYRYTEVSNDGTTTVAVLKSGGEEGKDVYLRWPNAGGTALQSYDNQETWVEPVKVTLES